MTFNEADHPRDTGKFADKRQTKPDLSLPAPRMPGVIGGYEIRGYKKISMGREGGAFIATIYKDGKRVVKVENSGNGGSNDYTELATGSRHYGKDIAAFRALAQKANPDGFEQEDAFIELIRWVGSIEKNIAKHNWPRDEVIEANIEATEKADGPLDDWEKAVLRNPETLDETVDSTDEPGLTESP